MEKVRSSLFKILILIIINVMLLPMCLPISKIFATSSIQMSLTTDDTRTTFSAGDIIVFNLNIDSIDSAVSTIQGYISFDTSLLEITIDDDSGLYNLLGTRIWSDAEYDDTQNSVLLNTTSSSGSNRTGTIQTIEFKVKRAASLSELAILIDEITASAGQGDLRTVDDIEYGDVSALRNNGGSGGNGGTGGSDNSGGSGDSNTSSVQFSMITDDTRTSFNAGDVILLKLSLDRTDSAMTTVRGYLDFDDDLIEVTYDDDVGLYNILSTNRVWSDGEYDPDDKALTLNTTNSSTGTSATGIVQTIEIKVKSATEYLRVEFNDITVSAGQGDLRDAVCTPYSIGTPPTPAATHQVTYDYGTNGGHKAGDNTTTTETANVAEGSSIPLQTGAKTDYTFVGWNTDATAHEALTSVTMGTEDVTLYAIYSKDVAVTFKSCSGLVQYTHSPTVTAKFYNNEVNSVPITFPTGMNCTRNGGTWAHVGWKNTTSKDPNEQNALLVTEGSQQSITQTDTTFYMLYSKQVTVSYVLNGNNDTYGSAPSAQSGYMYMNSNVVTDIEGYKPVITSLTNAGRYGYTISKWNTSANGSGTDYTIGVAPTTGFTENTTLYAQWTPNTNTPYKIKYYKQDPSNLNNYIEQIADEENLTGTTGTTVSVTPVSNKYGDGYEYDNGVNSIISATLTGPNAQGEATTTLKVYYSLKGDREWTVKRYKEDGDNPGTYNLIPGNETYSGFTGQNVTAPSKASEYEGYNERMDRGQGGTGTIQATNDHDNPLVLEVYYEAKTDTPYYIDYYLQNYDETWPTNPDSAQTDSRTGRTGSTVDISGETHKTIQGYLYRGNTRDLVRDTIAGNGTTRLKLYYEADDISYTVEHYVQDSSGNYILDSGETENLTAKTGTPVTAIAKTSILSRGDGYVENTTHSDRVVTGNVAPDGSLTLKVYYKRLITITLDRNDGTSTTPTTFQVPYGDSYGSSNLANLTRTGYDHNSRWTRTANDLSTQVSATDVVTAPHTLYAYWTPAEYTITLNNQSATSAGTASVKEVYNNGIYLGTVNASNLMTTTTNSITIPEKTAYVFRGYYTLANGNGIEMIDENGYITSNFTNTYYSAAGALYAKWVEKPTVFFDKRTNDPLVEGYTMESKEVVFGEPYGDIPQLTRKGYQFSGWYPRIDNNGNPAGTQITSSTTVTETGIHTIYAKWEAKQYTITFDKNTVYSIQVNPSSKTVTFDQPYGELPDLTGALGDGYTFGGWYTGVDSDGNVTGQQINSDDIVKEDRNQTLYAKWIPKPVSVLFKYIEPAETNPEQYPEGIQKTVTLNFDYNSSINTNILKQALSEKGVNLDDVIKNSDGTPKTFDTPKYTYTVEGNNNALDLTEVRNQSGRLTYDVTNISVNYNTEIRKYDVTFYDEDKTRPIDSIRDVNYGDYADILTIREPTKAPDNLNSYVFRRWLNKEDDSEVVFPYQITGPLEVYAQYTAIRNDYRVKFLDEDGTIINNKEDYHYGDTIIVPSNPTKPATQQYTYTFDHWVDELGNESNGSQLQTPTVDGDKVFTAVYTSEVNKYKVKFYNEAGDTILDEDEVDYGTNAMWNRNNNKPTPTKEPSNGYTYTFENKWLQSDRQTEDNLANVIEDRNVYVSFTPNPITYTIRYGYLLGATNNPNPTTYTVDDENIVLEPLGDRPGLTFLGWCADLECLEPITTIDTSRKENIIVYANWDVEELMYFAKDEQSIDNNDPSVIIYRDFNEAKDYVDTIFDNGRGQAIGIYDLKNDLIYYPRTLYYIKSSAEVDNENAIQYNQFADAKDYVLQEFAQGTTLGIYDRNNNLIYQPSEEQEPVIVEVPVVKYYVKDSAGIDNTQATEYDDFNQAKTDVDALFAQGTTTRIYDSNNNLVYEPKEDPEPEPVIIEVPVVKYYVKNSAEIDNTQAIEFDEFNDAKDYVDTLFAQGTTIKVYDSNNKLVYEPKEEIVPEPPIPVQEIKYFVKVNNEDESTDENTFDLFTDAKRKADELVRQGVKVYDINGEIVYTPEIEEEFVELYLRTEKYRIGENNFEEYEKGDIYFYRIDPYMTLSQFIGMCDTNGTITVYKQSGEKLKDNEFVGTGMILKDEKDGQYILLMLSVKGDIDGNGEITATDLATTNQQILKDVKLSGAQFLADDLNIDNTTTATDLAVINQAILKELDLKEIN